MRALTPCSALALVLVLTVGGPRPAAAQQGAAGAVPGTHALFPVHAPVLPAPPSAPDLDAADAVPLPATLQERRRRGKMYMIGGAVAIVVGAVVGDDGGTLLVIGGLATAGYGLYLWYQP